MLRQRLVRPYEHVEHVPNVKSHGRAEGPVAEFSSFASLEEKKRKSNLLMSFPKTGSQMGSFGQIRKKSFFSLLSADSRYFRTYALKSALK